MILLNSLRLELLLLNLLLITPTSSPHLAVVLSLTTPICGIKANKRINLQGRKALRPCIKLCSISSADSSSIFLCSLLSPWSFLGYARSLLLLHARELDEELVRSTLNVLLKFEEDIEATDTELRTMVRDSTSEAPAA